MMGSSNTGDHQDELPPSLWIGRIFKGTNPNGSSFLPAVHGANTEQSSLKVPARRGAFLAGVEETHEPSTVSAHIFVHGCPWLPGSTFAQDLAGNLGPVEMLIPSLALAL